MGVVTSENHSVGYGHIYGCGHKCGESVWGVVKCMDVVTSIGNNSMGCGHMYGCGHKYRKSQCGVWSHA